MPQRIKRVKVGRDRGQEEEALPVLDVGHDHELVGRDLEKEEEPDLVLERRGAHEVLDVGLDLMKGEDHVRDLEKEDIAEEVRVEIKSAPEEEVGVEIEIRLRRENTRDRDRGVNQKELMKRKS